MSSLFKSLRSARSFFFPCAAMAALLAVETASARALVMRSTGPSAAAYKPGKALADDARIVLKTGDTLTLFSAGATRTFRGPGTFALAGTDGGGQAADAGRRGRVSLLRTAGAVPLSPTLWHVDIARGGRICLVDGNPVTMWRADASRRGKLIIRNAKGTAKSVEWPAGRPVLAWPSAVPVVAGADYSLGFEGDATPTRLSFARLANAPTNLGGVVDALIQNRCEAQLDLLIQTMPAVGPIVSN